MPASSAACVRLSRPRWAAVLLGCLLSVLAPFAESTAVQVLEGVAPPADESMSDEEDSVDDEEDLYRGRGPDDSWQAERRQADFPLFYDAPDSPDPRLRPFSARRAAAYHRGPGCEHAYRNGSGTPLLC
jgi:hypothetical protein